MHAGIDNITTEITQTRDDDGTEMTYTEIKLVLDFDRHDVSKGDLRWYEEGFESVVTSVTWCDLDPESFQVRARRIQKNGKAFRATYSVHVYIGALSLTGGLI